MAEAQLSGLLRTLSGNLGNFTFRVTKNGIVVADRPIGGPSVTTAEQQFARTTFSTVTKAWKTITAAQRTAWKTYAQNYFPTDIDGSGDGPGGQAVYIKANWYRLASGQALVAAAPTNAPPTTPTNVTVQPAVDETNLVIAVTHTTTPVTNHRLFVEITPDLISPAHNPVPGDYRAVRGLIAASFPALTASGTSYTFTPIRFPLLDGVRFGIRATIIDPSGIPSLSFTNVLVQSVI